MKIKSGMIYFVRHGQTDWNLKGLYQGQIDIELNDTGIEQAKDLKLKLKDVSFNVVLSSPLMCAYQTAKIIHQGEIIIDNRLIERSNGQLEGKHKDNDDFIGIDFNDPNESRFDIESIVMFRKRIKEFWEEITEKYSGKTVLVVAHAGVGIYTQCYFKGEPKNENYKKYKVKNCDVLKLSYPIL